MLEEELEMIEEKPRAKATPKATPKKKAAPNGHSGNSKRAKGTLILF